MIEYSALDYDCLHREGIRLLERLSGHRWTDFNAHDPGITILEQLCYALTDLNYRIDYDMADLLAADENEARRWLFGPEQILVSGPVTDEDLRKMLLDIPGVQNAWIEDDTSATSVFAERSGRMLYLQEKPQRQRVRLRGIRQVKFAADSRVSEPLVLQHLQATRALAEDFTPPTKLTEQKIRVDADIEVGDVDDPNSTLAEVYRAVAAHIAPMIPFRSWNAISESGKSADRIFDGPRLENGFIDSLDLERHRRKTAIRKSDLIQVIMDVPGVRSIRSITVSSGKAKDTWYLELYLGETPILDLESSKIQLLRDNVLVSKRKVQYTGVSRDDKSPGYAPGDVQPEHGRDRQIEKYYSIQNQFPAAYGIGEAGLPAGADNARHAQGRQLSAYLCLFEQILANAFSQLAHAKDLLSPGGDDARSYFGQPLGRAVPGAAEVIVDANQPPDLENEQEGLARRSRFLNHLLARFGEQMIDLAQLAENANDSARIIRAKRALLRDLPRVGIDRGRGFDATLDSGDVESLSGLERRIHYKLGLDIKTERVYLLEHILLRPRRGDLKQWEPDDLQSADVLEPGQQDLDDVKQWTSGICNLGRSYGVLADPIRRDPYSAQVSFILPAWRSRFESAAAREFVSRTLRAEMPAHLHVHLHWLSKDDMAEFEDGYQVWRQQYRAWLNRRSVQQSGTPIVASTHLSPEGRDARDRMINLLGIGSTWPRRDLEVVVPKMQAAGERARIEIMLPQRDVADPSTPVDNSHPKYVKYELCDQDGSSVLWEGRPITARIDPADGAKMIIETPEMIEDRTFTIRASRPNLAIANRHRHDALDGESSRGKSQIQETYRNRTIRILAGINLALKPKFMPEGWRPSADDRDDESTAVGTSLSIDYNAVAYVAIRHSQQGVSYQVIDANRLATTEEGRGPDTWIYLKAEGYREDTTVVVRAFRTAEGAGKAQELAEKLTLKVRPNPAVGVNVASIVDYNQTATIELANTQKTVDYRLFRRPISLNEFRILEAEELAEWSRNDQSGHAANHQLIVEVDEGRGLALEHPLDDGDAPFGFDEIADFALQDSRTPPLSEDTLLLVRATKNTENNDASLWLDQACVVLVRPDAELTLRLEPSTVRDGAEALVLVERPLSAVRYQLIDHDGKTVGPPGYPDDDRGVGRSRVELDLVVGRGGPRQVKLPTGPIRPPATFHIQVTRYVGQDYSREPPVAMPDPIPLLHALEEQAVTFAVDESPERDES